MDVVSPGMPAEALAKAGGEDGIRSRMSGRPAHAPTRGPGPLVPSLCSGHPMKGKHPLQNPCSNPILYFGRPSSSLKRIFTDSYQARGGEDGIRTHGTVAGTRAFQARRIGHSRTSPLKCTSEFLG